VTKQNKTKQNKTKQNKTQEEVLPIIKSIQQFGTTQEKILEKVIEKFIMDPKVKQISFME
jgi:DNA-binding transcriptional regulator YhcF (GntR family)